MSRRYREADMANSVAPKGVLLDLTRCIGCRGCQVACKEWNQRSVKKTRITDGFTNPPDLNSECYTRIKFHERDGQEDRLGWDFTKVQCMHCQDPACASACPVGAFIKTPAGPVVYRAERCIGCRYCMIACPFQVPKYEWEKVSPLVQKCTFCADRIAAGLIPACIKVCPAGVMYYDDRQKVLAEAERRLQEKPGKYVDHIYGKEEGGGTSWMYISAIPFEQLGFNTKIPKVALPDLTWDSLAKIPYAVGGLAVLLSIIAYLRNRGNSTSSGKGEE